MIVRSYTCLNRNCLNEFDSTEDHPPCARCGGLRVKWLPRPVAIGTKAASIDRDVRALADTYGMTDLRSPVRDQGMAVPAQSPPPDRNLPFQPSQGWGMNLPAACLSGQGAAFCAPVKIDMKNGALPPPSQKFGPTWKPTGPTPQIEGSYRPPGGLPDV